MKLIAKKKKTRFGVIQTACRGRPVRKDDTRGNERTEFFKTKKTHCLVRKA